MPDGVIFQHELAGQRSVRVEGYSIGPIELVVAKSSNGCRRAAPLLRSRLSTASFVAVSFSFAWPAFILWTSSHVTPSTGLPSASICANWISSGYARNVMHDDADLAPRPSAPEFATLRL